MEENPANVAPPPGDLDGRPSNSHSSPRNFGNRARARVRFLGGNPELQQKVAAVAQQWSQFANIRFDFGNDPVAEIRVAFIPGKGSWSAVGTDSLGFLGVLTNQPTMNFGWLTNASSAEEISRVVLHEFGHALG